MIKNFEINQKNPILKVITSFLGNLFFSYCLIIALALILFSVTTIECEVTGESMQPTFNSKSGDKHDIVFVNKYIKDYNYNDIIVISTTHETIIKRVLGLPGDIIDFVEVDNIYRLERNGEIINEDYIKIDYDTQIPSYEKNGMYNALQRFNALKESKPQLFDENGKLVVGDFQVFALGDNRKVSVDSTVYGPFDYVKIVGVVELTKYYGDSDFEFYFNYLKDGKFVYTFLNLFK